MKKVLIISIIFTIIVLTTLLILSGIINSNKEILYIYNGSVSSTNGFNSGEYIINYRVKNDGSVYNSNINERIGKLNFIKLISLKINLLRLKWKISIYDISEKDRTYKGEFIEIDGKRYGLNQFSFYEDASKIYKEIIKQVEWYE